SNAKIENGVLDNTATGQINVTGTSNEIDSEGTFTNAGHLEVLAGAALLLSGDSLIDNTSGFITVDAAANPLAAGQLTLTSTTINHGELDNSGTLVLTSNAKIENGVLDNTATGQINVTGTSNEIDSEGTFTNAGHLEVMAGAALLLSGDSLIDNTSGFITVDAAANPLAAGQLTLTSTTINHGELDNSGTLVLTSNAKIENGVLDNTATGQINVTGT